MDEAVLLYTDQLTKSYGTKIKTEVLHGIDLSIKRKEFTSIVGYSGSGKSTLLNILGALDRPSSGDVFFHGQSYEKMSENALADFRNRELGFIFQFHHLMAEFNVIENVLIPIWISKGRSNMQERKRAKNLLEMMGLESVLYNKATDLSGGQQQRVAIARALIRQPSIIFADEPTGNLDLETTEVVFELFKTINKELGTSLLLVTHNTELAARTRRRITMSDGQILSDEILNNTE